MTPIVQVLANLLAIKDFMIVGGKQDEWIQMMNTVSDQVQTLVLAAGTSADDNQFLTENRAFIVANAGTSIQYNGQTYFLNPPKVYMMSYAERELFYQQNYNATAGAPTIARSTLTAFQANGVVRYFFD